MKTAYEMYKLGQGTSNAGGMYVVEIDEATKKKVSAYEQSLQEQVKQIKLLSNNSSKTLLEKEIATRHAVIKFLTAEQAKHKDLYYAIIERNRKTEYLTTGHGEEIIQCKPDEVEKFVCCDRAKKLLHHYSKEMHKEITSSNTHKYQSSLQKRIKEEFGVEETLKTDQEKEKRLEGIVRFLRQERLTIAQNMDTYQTDDVLKTIYENINSFVWNLLFSSTNLLGSLKRKNFSLSSNVSLDQILTQSQTQDVCIRLKYHLEGLKKQAAVLDIKKLEELRDSMKKQDREEFWRILNNFIEENRPKMDSKKQQDELPVVASSKNAMSSLLSSLKKKLEPEQTPKAQADLKKYLDEINKSDIDKIHEELKQLRDEMETNHKVFFLLILDKFIEKNYSKLETPTLKENLDAGTKFKK